VPCGPNNALIQWNKLTPGSQCQAVDRTSTAADLKRQADWLGQCGVPPHHIQGMPTSICGRSSASGGTPAAPPEEQAGANCVDTYPACPGWVGQCASPGVPTYCPCMCKSGSAPPPPVTPPPSPPSNPPSPPSTPPPPSQCPDTYPACPGWVGQCSVPGVATYCPCMCGKGQPPISPPPVSPPPVSPPPGNPPAAPLPTVPVRPGEAASSLWGMRRVGAYNSGSNTVTDPSAAIAAKGMRVSGCHRPLQ
jgi:hypothetical protein